MDLLSDPNAGYIIDDDSDMDFSDEQSEEEETLQQSRCVCVCVCVCAWMGVYVDACVSMCLRSLYATTFLGIHLL